MEGKGATRFFRFVMRVNRIFLQAHSTNQLTIKAMILCQVPLALKINVARYIRINLSIIAKIRISQAVY